MKRRPTELGVERIGTVAIAAAALAALAVVAAVVAPTVRQASQHEHALAAGTGSGQTRVVYLAADKVRWDYAPQGRNLITGQPFDDQADVFVKSGPGRIGRVYVKAQYRAYTDASFITLTPIPDQWRHLGILGPVIHAEVGDTVKVLFKNNLDRPASVHAHGVFYAKDSEGAPYQDGTGGADQADDAVAPGKTHTYTWQVPERAGPGPMDPSSIMWMYHSHVNEVRDSSSGLQGPIVVTRRGMARPDGTPNDVDRELVAHFQVTNENISWYLDESFKRFASGTRPSEDDPDFGDFQESNLMHAINGYVFGNLPGLELTAGQRVRWYLMGMGSEVDLHTPHWHGNTVVVAGMRTDVSNLLPATMQVADMVPDDPGSWLFHCHVNDHILAGMQARYQVTGN
jgi:FtsP/CotA-like multicopper oxidase with cupredoxin domain